MAEQKHLEWLLEGVEAWNARRRTDPFTPDFSGADLDTLFRDAGKANERHRIDLSGANFTRADFNAAKIVAADFINADLGYADLRDADFWFADFSNANMSRAILNENTNLVHSPLVNVNLDSVEPWIALLHDPKWRIDTSKHLFDHSVVTIDSISSAISFVNILRHVDANTAKDIFYTSPGHSLDFIYYFRGESDDKWSLQPSVMRDEKKSNRTLHEFESQMFQDLTTRRPIDFNTLNLALDKWALAQHHGLPTRFLDVTRNVLVALFWACQGSEKANGKLHVFCVPRSLVKSSDSDTISIIANFARLPKDQQDLLLGKKQEQDANTRYEPYRYFTSLRTLYQLIREEKPHFEERIDIKDLYQVFVVEPQHLTERLRAQSGAFLVSAFHERFEQYEILSKNRRIPTYHHYALSVLGDKKPHMLEDLRLLNITSETLMPGLDASASVLTGQYRDRLDTIA